VSVFEEHARRARKKRLWSAGGQKVTQAPTELIAHRSPFLLIDRIEEVDLPGQTVWVTAAVREDDPILTGHFPGDPIYPGVLQIEMMGQSCLALLGLMQVSPKSPIRLSRVLGATFEREIRPPAPLDVYGQVVELHAFGAWGVAQIIVSDAIVSACVLEVQFVGA